MSSRHKRRPGGHPAKIAAKRKRDEQAAIDRQNPGRRAAKRLSEAFAEARHPLAIEDMTSSLLGRSYPEQIGLGDNVDALEEDAYLDLVSDLEHVGTEAALAMLCALADVSSTDVGIDALDAAARLHERGIAYPHWHAELQDLKISRAAELHEPLFDDGYDALLEIELESGEKSTLCVLIDNNRNGEATSILVHNSIDQFVEEMTVAAERENFKMELVDADPGVVASRILDAIDLADRTLGNEPDEDYRELRSLARARCFATAGSDMSGEHPYAEEAEREEALRQFLESPFAAEFVGEEAQADLKYLAELAIDFSANYTGGDLMRWSPPKLEYFLAGWIPRKVLGDPSDFERMPDVAMALTRYWAEPRGAAPEQLQECRDVIGRCAPEMLDGLTTDDPEDISKSMLRAAQEAGVDFEDEEDLAKFIAGWNARSMLEE